MRRATGMGRSRARAAGVVVEGEPIEVELTMRDGAPAARPSVRVGAAQLAPVGGPSAGAATVLRYAMERAGGLGAPTEPVIDIHVAP